MYDVYVSTLWKERNKINKYGINKYINSSMLILTCESSSKGPRICYGYD